MKRIFYFIIFIASINKLHAYTSAYIGWENFISPALPDKSKADTLVFGMIGNTPTRIYFHYAILGQYIITSGASCGNLGWGADIQGGLGYRFLNPAYKKSGWDLGLDIFGYFTPYFLNSEIGYTETAFYYGIGLGFSTVYKINPNIGTGFRTILKYNTGTKYLASRQPNTQGILFSIGALITF